MAQAGKTLYIAGPPDLVDEEITFMASGEPDTQKKLADQLAAFEGQRGAILRTVSATDGRKLTERNLDVTPVFDGMAIANGRIYMALTDGSVLCLGD